MVLSPWQCRIYRQECCLKCVGTGDSGMLSAGIQWSMTLLGWTLRVLSSHTSASGMEFRLSWKSENNPMFWNTFYNTAKVAACCCGPSKGVYAMRQCQLIFHADCEEIPLEFSDWLPAVTHRCCMSNADVINKHQFSWNSFWRMK